MANSLLKLTVESSEYDAKLKKAAEGVRHLADVAHKSAGDMTGLEQSTLDYIKSIGEMETKSRSAAGQVRELESTYKELKVIYDQLNEVEKADEGGKALAASLEQLKQRAQDARTSLDNASKSLQENDSAAKEDSSALEALASKFTVNIDALKLFNIGLQAAGVALDVAKDAFFSSESNVDDWGRTIQASESVYNSFLQSLNTGDFSGFLNNIGQVTQAAKDAYNALDELGTRMTIINPERAKLQARQQELRATIRREGKDSDAGKQALAELKNIEPKLSKSFQTESKMNRTAFEALVKQRLAEGGINLNQKSFQQFMKTFSSDDAFQQLRKNARGSSELKATSEIGKFKTIDTRNVEQKLMDLFTDEWRKANSGYLTAAFNAQGAAATNALGNARYMKAGAGSGKTQKQEQTEIQKNQKAINDLEQEYLKLIGQTTEAADKRRTAIRDEISKLTKRNDLLKFEIERAHGKFLGVGDFAGDMQKQGLRAVNKKAPDVRIKSPLLLSDKTMAKVLKDIEKNLNPKEQKKYFSEGLGQLSGGLSSITGGLQQLGIEIPEGMQKVLGGMQAISSILGGIASTVLAIEAIAGADALIPLNRGGVVPHAAFGRIIPGNSMSGDNIYAGNAWVNSGELVLNRFQQSALAANLQGGGGVIEIELIAKGEQLRAVMNNNGRRTGRGEFVQSNRIRVR